MASRDALRALRERQKLAPGPGRGTGAGFAPRAGNVGKADGWTPPPRPSAPLDYAVGCVDPIGEDETDRPDRTPGRLTVAEVVLLASLAAIAAILLVNCGGG